MMPEGGSDVASEGRGPSPVCPVTGRVPLGPGCTGDMTCVAHGLPPEAGRGTSPWSEVAADLLHLADRIEREHADDRFCACCSTDAIHLRDLAARYARKADHA